MTTKRKKVPEEDFLKRNADKLQFWTNVGLLVVTILAVLVSLYYSGKNLELSTKQYKSAMDQFKYLRHTDSLKNINDIKKEREISEKAKIDSIHAAKNEDIQNSRNKHQDSLNSQQLAINKEQLKAIKIQASTAQNQFYQQQDEYKQELYEKRPVFNIDSVRIDSSNSYKPKISFVFTNRGTRIPHVDSVVLAFYNPDPKYLCLSVTKKPTSFDLVPQQMSMATSWINIFNDCLKAASTEYYLLIYYKDTNTGLNQTEPIFFYYTLTKQHQFSYSKIYGPTKLSFMKELKKKNIYVPD